MPVVAAGELDDLRATRERSREPERAHRRLGARAHEPNEIEARHRIPDQARQLELERARRAEARPRAGGVVERRDDARMRVPEDQRAPGEDVVDVAVAVDVDEVRALAALDEEWCATDGTERPNRRADPARHQAHCLCEELLRSRRAPHHTQRTRQRKLQLVTSDSSVMWKALVSRDITGHVRLRPLPTTLVTTCNL